MGKQVKGWTPPAGSVLVDSTTDDAWTPPDGASLVEDQPVKKKDVSTLPAGGGVLTQAAQQSKPSERNTANGSSSADLGALDFNEQVQQMSPYKKDAQEKVRNPLITLKRKGEDVLLYQVPASLMATGAAGLGATRDLVKYPESKIRSTGALPVNYAEKSQREIEDIDRRLNTAYVRAQQHITAGTFSQGNFDTLLSAINDATERKNFLQKFNPGYDKSKIRQWQKGILEVAMNRSQSGAKISENLVNRISEVNDPLDAINYTFGTLAESGVQIPVALATFGAGSVGQSIGSIYMDQVLQLAQERGISPKEVIDKGLDLPAAAITYGVASGALDLVGAKGVASGISKSELTKSLRQRSLQFIKETGGAGLSESGTELSQTILEQVGANKKLDPAEIAESALKGFIGGGGVHAVMSAVQPKAKTPKQPQTKQEIVTEMAKVDPADTPTLEANAEAIQKAVEQPDETSISIPEVTKTMTGEDSGAYEFGRNIEGEDQTLNNQDNAETLRKNQEPVPEQRGTDQGSQDDSGQDIQLKEEQGQNDAKTQQQTQGIEKKLYHQTSTTDALEDGVLKLPSQKSLNQVKTSDDAVFFSEMKNWEGRHDLKAKVVFDHDTLYEKAKLEKGKNDFEKEHISKSEVPMTKEFGLKEIVLYTTPSRDSVVLSGELRKNANFKPDQELILADQYLEQQHKKNKDRMVAEAQKYADRYQVPVYVQPFEGSEHLGDIEVINPTEPASKQQNLTTQELISDNAGTYRFGEATQSRGGESAEAPKSQSNEDQTQGGQRRQEGLLETGGETPGAPPPSTEPTPEAAAPTSAQRAFAQQILNDPNISDEVKRGLSSDAINYIPKGIRITDSEAKAIIQAKGEAQAQADFLDMTNGMTPDTRVALGENLIRILNQKGDVENAVKVADNLSKYFTDLGRAVNAAKIFSMLSPEGVLKYVAREITKQKDKFTRNTQQQRKKAKKAIDEINKKAVGKVLDSPKIKAKIASGVKKGSIKKAIDFLETLKVDTKGKLLEGTYGLTAAAWNTLITAVQKGLQAGLTISQAINKAVQKVKTTDMDVDGAKAYLDEQLKDYRVTLDPQRAIKEELKSRGEKIDDIIRKHYTDANTARKSLIDKLVKDANLPEEEARSLQKSLADEFQEMTKEAKMKALQKMLPKAKNKVPNARKQAIDQIIESSNLGALKEEDIRDVISEKLGVPSMDEKQARKLTDLANKVQTAKSDFERNNRTQDLMNYVKGLEGWSWADVGMAIWYANILSGISTQVLNATANAMETIGEAFVAAVQNPKQAPWIFQGLFQGYGRGLLESGAVLKSGYDPTKHEQKIGTAGTLERTKFAGGKWNPFNYLKFVGRLMTATDIFFYHGLNEMRARELAVMEARKQGTDKPNKNIIKRANEILYKGANPWDEAREQAGREGYEGSEAKRRAYEILEKSRPEFIIKDSNDEAARGTFNFDPEGTIGAMTAGINKFIESVNIAGVKPLKFIIPFTRIISNVLNRYLDWSPVGLLRAAKGGIGYETLGENFHRRYTPEERRDVMIRAITGMTAMAAIYALTDDEDGPFEITADGTGDTFKNFELQETGWRPYSLRVGDTWYECKNTPLAIPFATIGYMRDAQKFKGDKDWEAKMSIIMFGAAKYIMDMSFLQALSGFFDTFSKNNPGGAENFFKKTTKNTESTVKSVFVPNAFTQVSRAMQEVMDLPIKRANQVGDQIIRDMPLLRNHLGNIYNALGEPVVPNQIEKFIPLKPSKNTSESEKIWDLIIDNNAWIGRPRRSTQKLNGEVMTDEEYDRFALKAGQLTKEKLQIMYPILSRMKDKEEVKDEIGKLKAEARREARELLFGF